MPTEQPQAPSTALTVIVDDVHFLERGDDDEPRARDVDVATFFGKTRPRDIRGLIVDHREELEKNGPLHTRARRTRVARNGRGSVEMEVHEYWLNEAQVYNVGALMRTLISAELRPRMARLFAMVRQRTTPLGRGIPPELLTEIRAAIDGRFTELNERIDQLHDVMVIPDHRLVRFSHFHASLLGRLLDEACEVEARWHTLRRGKRVEAHQARLGVLRRVETATRTANIADLEIEKWPAALLEIEEIISKTKEKTHNHPPDPPLWANVDDEEVPS
jgi:hypothetical protein